MEIILPNNKNKKKSENEDLSEFNCLESMTLEIVQYHSRFH
jgi:hypothetical protein